MIYLDHSATTPLRHEVQQYICELMEKQFGNPSALYDLGIASDKIVKQARETIAKTLKAKPGEIIFTSCGSESNNLALKGAGERLKKKGRHILISAVEHPSVSRTAAALKDQGFEVEILPVTVNGTVDSDILAAAVRADTIIVSIMMVNNEIGTLMPIQEYGKIIHEQNPNCLFHVDGVQGYGRIPVDVKRWGIDMFSLSGHKIGAPKGIGVLYVRDGIKLAPLICGGGQEMGLRSGTENFYYIGGLALAAKISLENREEKNNHLEQVKKTLLKELDERGIEYVVNGGDTTNAVGHILNLTFPNITGEVLLHFLEGENIYVSQGSACHAKSKNPSETLSAIGLNKDAQLSTLRFSFGDDTKTEDMALVAEALAKGINFISAMGKNKGR